MAGSLPPAFALTSRTLGSAPGGPLEPVVQSRPVVFDDAGAGGPSRKRARQQVVVSAAGEGWTVYDATTQASLSSQTFPPSVRFASPTCALSTNRTKKTPELPGRRKRFVYTAIAAHPTHTSLAVREGRSVWVHVEAEGKGGFGETLSDDPISEGRPKYREFDAPVLDVCVVDGSPAHDATIAVLLRTGDIVVCDEDLQEVLERRRGSAEWPDQPPQNAFIQIVTVRPDDAQAPATLVVQVLQPVLREGAASTRAKKRKGTATDHATQPSPAALTCVMFVYGASGNAAQTGRLPGDAAAVTVASSGQVGVVRETGDVEIWMFDGASHSDRLALLRRLRLDTAGLAPLRPLACTVYLDSSQPDVLVVVALSKDPTSSLVALLLNARLAKVMTSASIPVPTASQAAGRVAINSTAGDAIMILGLEADSRQSLQVQTIDVSRPSLTAAASFTDPEVRQLSARWLHPAAPDARGEDKQLLERIDRSRCAGVGEVTVTIVKLWTEGGYVWTQESAARADDIWMEWAHKPRSERQMRKLAQILSAAVVRVLALACLSPFKNEAPAAQAQGNVAPYPGHIVNWLLRQNLLADSTLAPEGGLLVVLTRAGRWRDMIAALTALPDLTDVLVMLVLRRALDEPGRPRLGRVLFRVTSWASEDGEAHQALTASLTVTEVAAVLEVLLVWTLAFAEGDLKEGQVDATARARYLVEVPPPKQVAAFTSLLLGSHSIALLQYAPSHPVLKALAAATGKWLQQEREAVKLVGPLGEFSRRRRTAQIASRRAAELAAHEGVKANGKSRLGGPGQPTGGRPVNAAREAAMDAHREVGPYSMEKLEL